MTSQVHTAKDLGARMMEKRSWLRTNLNTSWSFSAFGTEWGSTIAAEGGIPLRAPVPGGQDQRFLIDVADALRK
jgi:hypothetical protein